MARHTSQPGSDSPNPRVYLLAGPNGAGKSTFARRYLSVGSSAIEFLNADVMAAALSPLDPAQAALRAGRLLIEETCARVAHRSTFGLETTLSGFGYVRWIDRWRDAGYHIHLTYIRLQSAELAISRVAARVRQGGHFVAEDVIRRRYERGWQLFETHYKPLADRWMVLENSGPAPILIDQGGSNGDRFPV